MPCTCLAEHSLASTFSFMLRGRGEQLARGRCLWPTLQWGSWGGFYTGPLGVWRHPGFYSWRGLCATLAQESWITYLRNKGGGVPEWSTERNMPSPTWQGPHCLRKGMQIARWPMGNACFLEERLLKCPMTRRGQCSSPQGAAQAVALR